MDYERLLPGFSLVQHRPNAAGSAAPLCPPSATADVAASCTRGHSQAATAKAPATGRGLLARRQSAWRCAWHGAAEACRRGRATSGRFGSAGLFRRPAQTRSPGPASSSTSWRAVGWQTTDPQPAVDGQEGRREYATRSWQVAVGIAGRNLRVALLFFRHALAQLLFVSFELPNLLDAREAPLISRIRKLKAQLGGQTYVADSEVVRIGRLGRSQPVETYVPKVYCPSRNGPLLRDPFTISSRLLVL